MKLSFWAGITLATLIPLVTLIPARAQDYSAKLSGFQEVGGLGAGETGAILSAGQATLKLSVDKNAETLTYSLTYSGLANVAQAHIHFGKKTRSRWDHGVLLYEFGQWSHGNSSLP